jgi:hypothetical protein
MPAEDDMRAALDRIARERAEIEKVWEQERAFRERESAEVQMAWEREQKAREQERARTQKEWAETLERRKKESEAFRRETPAPRQAVAAPEQAASHTGGMVDRIVIPDLVKQFAKLRYRFTKISRNIEFEDPQAGVHTVINALLENNDRAMVVAIRPALAAGDITDLVERLRALRKYADARNSRQQFYGALAAAAIDTDLKTSVLKQGFYIIESSAETVTVIPPAAKPAVF